MILNNISDTIEIISNMNITFGEFVEYINRHPEASSSANDMIEYERDIMSDTDDLVKGIFDSLIHEEEGFGKIYTDLQLNIFERFKSPDM